MSTQYQNYSQNNQTFVQQNMGYTRARATSQPQVVPMSTPMFQPVPMYYQAQPLPQLQCTFQGMTLTPPTPPVQQGSSPYFPVSLSPCGSFDLPSPPCGFQIAPKAMPGSEFTIPMVHVGPMDAYPNTFRSPSPAGLGPQPHMFPSYSPQPYPAFHTPPQMMNLLSAGSSPVPSAMFAAPQQPQARARSPCGGVTITAPDSFCSVTPPMQPPLPESLDPSLLGYRGVSSQRSLSPDRHRSVSRPRSISDLSAVSEEKRESSVEEGEPSKRDLVNRAFAQLQAMFGDNFDQNGNRGNNIIRLKVKTRNALQQIVPLIEFCQQGKNLIKTISCPISTKKGRQQVRGFLAYLEMKNETDADRVEQLIKDYNAQNASPFHTWHRNPPSTWESAV